MHSLRCSHRPAASGGNRGRCRPACALSHARPVAVTALTQYSSSDAAATTSSSNSLADAAKLCVASFGLACALLTAAPDALAAKRPAPPISTDPDRCEVSQLDKFADTRGERRSTTAPC